MSGLTRAEWGLLGASWAAYIGAIVASVAPPEWAWKGPIIAAGLLAHAGFTGWQIRYARNMRAEETATLRAELEQRNADHAELAILNILEQTCDWFGGPGVEARSSLFLIGADSRLAIAYDANMDDAPDREIQFERLQGCAGHVWGTGEQTVTFLRDTDPADLRERWKLTPAQIRLTQDLRGIVCTPIRDPDEPDRVLGVHAVDWIGDQDPDELTDEMLDNLLQTAAILGGLLRMGGLIEGEGHS